MRISIDWSWAARSRTWLAQEVAPHYGTRIETLSHGEGRFVLAAAVVRAGPCRGIFDGAQRSLLMGVVRVRLAMIKAVAAAATLFALWVLLGLAACGPIETPARIGGQSSAPQAQSADEAGGVGGASTRTHNASSGSSGGAGTSGGGM